jgi:hypothetical protein
MNSPQLSFELREKYLLVTGYGKRDNLTAMAEAAALIYEKVQEMNISYLLVDYRQLQINLKLSEAFNIVRQYETTLPRFKQTTIAAVFEGKGIEFGTYWKDIGDKRGFLIEVFEDLKSAEEWLLKQIKS